jgi:hypothetical protein
VRSEAPASGSNNYNSQIVPFRIDSCFNTDNGNEINHRGATRVFISHGIWYQIGYNMSKQPTAHALTCSDINCHLITNLILYSRSLDDSVVESSEEYWIMLCRLSYRRHPLERRGKLRERRSIKMICNRSVIIYLLYEWILNANVLRFIWQRDRNNAIPVQWKLFVSIK